MAIGELATSKVGLLIHRTQDYSVDFEAQQAIPEYDVLAAVAYLVKRPSGRMASTYAGQTYLSHVPLRIFVQRPLALHWLQSFV